MVHLRQAFDSKMHELEQDVVRLGTVVEKMLVEAMQSLMAQDLALAASVVRQDDIADRLDFEIEQECIRLIALQQPLSRDLRTVTTIIKIIADMERVGDYSVDIAKTGERMAGQPFFKPMVDIPLIGEKVSAIVHDTLRAFVDRDLALARRICEEDDDEVDEIHDRLFEELIALMQQRPEIVPQATRFLLISRYLERIADHCTNIAERIAYMETGRLEELKVKDEDRAPT